MALTSFHSVDSFCFTYHIAFLALSAFGLALLSLIYLLTLWRYGYCLISYIFFSGLFLCIVLFIVFCLLYKSERGQDVMPCRIYHHVFACSERTLHTQSRSATSAFISRKQNRGSTQVSAVFPCFLISGQPEWLWRIVTAREEKEKQRKHYVSKYG